MGISNPSGSISLYPPSGTLSNPPGSISTGETEPPFDPATLFESGTYGGGFWLPHQTYNGSPALYQDSAGTIPVTADGDPVGRIVDLSGNGNHFLQAVALNRAIYHTDGTNEWISPDGTDDFYMATLVDMKASVTSSMVQATEGPGVTASILVISELSIAPSTTAGVTGMTFTADGVQVYRHKGTTDRFAQIQLADVPSVPAVFSGRASISTPNILGYVNGVQKVSNVLTQGTGTLLNYPMYLFSRAGTTLFFNQPWYGGMLVSRYLTDDQLSDTNSYFQGIIP